MTELRQMLKGRLPRVLDVFPLKEGLASQADRFRQLALSSKAILISSTLTSDGDSVGAQLALLSLLRTLRGSEEDLWIVNHSECPERYRFLKGSEKILDIHAWKKLKQKPVFDLGVTMDGGIERTGDVAPLFDGVKARVLVDHHAIGSQMVYDSSLLDLDVSSTCELVYHLFEYFQVPVDRSIAEQIYVGIVFDTGFFKHSLTKPKTHLVSSHLIETGIDFSKVSDRAILERTWEAQLLLRALLSNMERHQGGKVVLSYWSRKDLDEIRPKDGDQEGMINQLYYLDTVEVVVLLTEIAVEDIKVSFRSKGRVNVAELARAIHPEGGGHERASGCRMRVSLDRARSEILRRLENI